MAADRKGKNKFDLTPKGSRGGVVGNHRIVWTEDQISPRLSGLPEKLNAYIGAMMAYQAPKVQDHMRTTAPWTDRTGNARNGLFARYNGGAALASSVINMRGANGGSAGQMLGGAVDSHAIDLYHTVPYGIWLEVRWSGKYAVIAPTIQTEGPRVMAAIQGLMGKMN